MKAFFPWLCLPALAAADLSGLHGPALRAALHSQVRGHTVIPYSSSRFDTADALRQLDGALDGTNAVVRLIYGNGTAPAGAFGVTGGWNREHLWPNSYGLDDVEPAFSDLHNLRACDANVNSARGNKFYDLSDRTAASFRFPAHAEAPLCSTDTDSWEPPAHQRGDIARALFYMDVRYEGDAPNEPNLQLTETDVGSDRAMMGRLSALLRWNEQDPPDDAERARDEAVARLQGNHNPFVASPALANALYLPPVYPGLLTDGNVVFFTVLEAPLNGQVIWEYARDPAGPWSTVEPKDADAAFCRVRLKD